MTAAGLLLSCLVALPAAAAPAGQVERIAVRPSAADPELAAAIEQSRFLRWLVPAFEDLEVVVDAHAEGDVRVDVTRLPASPELVRRLEGLPVRLTEDSIVLDGTAYRHPGHALAVRLPVAEGSAWVVAGRDPELLAELVARAVIGSSRAVRRRVVGAQDFDYLLYETRFLERYGSWRAVEGVAGELAVDASREVDRIAERDRAWASLADREGRHLSLAVPRERADDPALGALAERLDRAAGQMAASVPMRLARPLRAVAEKDFVHLGRAFAEVAETVVPEPGEGAGDLHLVFAEDDLDAHRFGVARALVARAGLELPPAMADGAALWLSRGWYGRPYESYLGAFAAARVLPSAAELLAAERPRDGSRVVWPAVAAAVLDRQEGDTLRAKVAALGEAGAAAARVEAALAALAELPAPPPASPPTGRLPRLDGVSLAMTPGIEHAYHGPGVARQLERFEDLGANAVAIMPYAFQRAPDDPAFRPIQGDPGDENDAGLLHAARRAKERGFAVLWKPHVYVTGSWPGEIEMGSDGDWEAWWRAYRRYVIHQAVLARFAGAEVFSVGVELGRTVSREADWRHLIASVRRVFPGRVTYCGNWWGDFDRVAFWDALDLVAVDAYFPLADDAAAPRDTLADGARAVVEQLAAAAQRHRRPVLLAELGYAARRGAWVAPHEEGGELDETHQRLAYEVFFEALGQPDWLAGVFVWKAFSHPDSDRGGPRADFRFLARQAETAIGSYFGAAR